MKGESWNTISDSLTLVLSILISIHHSAERSQRTFSINESLQPEAWFHFKIRYQLFDWRNGIANGREIFSIQCLRYFTLSSTLPRIVSTFTRASLSIPLSSIEKRGERRLERRSTLVSRVLYGGASDYASQRLPGTALQSRFPWRNGLLPCLFYTRWKTVYIYIYACSLKRKYGEIISRRHRRRINNFSTFPGRIAIDNRLS